MCLEVKLIVLICIRNIIVMVEVLVAGQSKRDVSANNNYIG